MSRPSPERLTAQLHRDQVVVFLIGMSVNAWWKPWRWLPVALAMGKMLKELGQKPEAGLLATRGGGPGVMVQYWESFEHLAQYASDRQGQHYPAWAAFNRALAKSGEVGIWHETYIVPSSQIESVYHHTKPAGLGLIGELVPARGHKLSAKQRIKAAQEEAAAATAMAQQAP